MEKHNYPYLTQLRAIAIAMVVLLHVAAPVRDQLEHIATLNWFIGAIFDGLARMGVPLFVMIGGATLLLKDEPIGTFFRKRLARILVPFLAWGMLYGIYAQQMAGKGFRPFEVLLSVLQGPAFYHLWYLYMLIGLYLMTPFMRILIQHIQKKQLEILLLLWLVFSIILPHTYAEMALWFKFNFHFGFDFKGVDLYLGYFILGYYLNRYATANFGRITYLLSYFVVSFLMVGYSYLLYQHSNGYNPLAILNESPFVLLQAVLLFLAFKAKPISENSAIAKLVTQISAISFGIYLIHPIIIDLLHEGSIAGFVLDSRQMDTILSIPATFIVVFTASLLVSYLISKVPILRRSIG